MKLGVMTVLLGDLTLEETLKYLKSLGVQAVEIGCGGTPGTAHANAVEFIKNPRLIDEFKGTIDTATRCTPKRKLPRATTSSLKQRCCWRKKSGWIP